MFWYIPALAAAVFTSLSNITKKKTLNKEHSREFIVIYKIAEAILIALILLPFIDFSIPLFVIGLLYLFALISSFADFYIVRAYRHKDISVVSPLSNLTLLFLPIIAFLFLGERIGLTHLGGIGFILVGAYLLEIKRHIFRIKYHFKEVLRSKYSLYVIFAVFLYAICSAGDKFVLKYVTPYTAVSLIIFFIAINYIIADIFIFKQSIKKLKKGLSRFGNWIFLAALFAVLADIAYFIAISLTYVSLVIPIKRLSTLFDTIVGGEFFKEKHLLQKSLACIIILVGVFLVII